MTGSGGCIGPLRGYPHIHSQRCPHQYRDLTSAFIEIIRNYPQNYAQVVILADQGASGERGAVGKGEQRGNL
jgi:hypothetical protein